MRSRHTLTVLAVLTVLSLPWSASAGLIGYSVRSGADNLLYRGSICSPGSDRRLERMDSAM